MATWTTPKTNWTRNDYFSHTDYNRIKNNLVYINDMLNEMYPDKAVELDLGDDLTYGADYPPSKFNALENALDLFKRIGVDVSIGDKKTFRANEAFIDAGELNRLERCCLRWHNVDPSISSVSITPELFNVYVGYTHQLTLSVSPDTASYTVTWSSSDDSVLTVDSTGLVTGVGEGSAVITATLSQSGRSDKTAESIGISEIAVIKSVSLNPSTLTFTTIGETKQIQIVTVPSEANNYSVVWNSSNIETFSVDSNGLVTYLAEGNATITAIITDNVTGETFMAECECKYRGEVTTLAFEGANKTHTGYILPANGVLLTINVKPSSNQDADIEMSGTSQYLIISQPTYGGEYRGCATYFCTVKSTRQVNATVKAKCGDLVATVGVRFVQ